MSTDRDHDLERLLDADKGTLASLYHRLPRNEPPRRLDRTVLADAARAVRAERAPRAQRWLVGFGSAAGLVMAAGIAWQVGGQMESRDKAHSAETQTPASSRVIAVQAISERAPTPAAAEPLIQQEEKSTASAATVVKRKVVPAVSAAPAPMRAAAPAAEVRKAESAEAFADAIESERSAPMPQQKTTTSDNAVSIDNAASDRLRTNEVQEKSGATPSQSVSKRAPAPSSSATLRRNMRLAPQDWLAEIVRLKREGHRQQAVENLLLFRRQYPDWALSDDLRKLSE
jgi:hypothetical protein